MGRSKVGRMDGCKKQRTWELLTPQNIFLIYHLSCALSNVSIAKDFLLTNSR
jgi:hypothetical protein